MFKLLLQHNYPNSKIQTNSIWYSWKRIAKCFFKIRRKGNQEYNFHDFWGFKGTVRLYVCVRSMGLDNRDPRPGEIARVGGHRRQPVLNPAMHEASDAGHIEPHGMRRCLSFSYRGTAACRRPSPGGTKTAHFWRVLDVHKTSQIPLKMALGRG